MQKILQEIKNKNLNFVDTIIYYHLYNYKYKMFTAKQIIFIFPYRKATIYNALKNLVRLKLIETTKEYPIRYYIKND